MTGELVASAWRFLPYFRGRHRILNALLPEGGSREASIYGYRMVLDLADFIQRNIYIGSYEVEETKWVKRLLRTGMTFVDVGANVGYYVALASRRVGSRGRVLAFEPSPYAFEKLKSFIDSNSITQATCWPVALSNRQGSITLYVPPEFWHNHNPTVIQSGEGMTPITVPTQTLDAFVKEFAIERVDLSKIDVEGHEPELLQGIEESIRSGKVRAILAEFHPAILARAGSSPEILQGWLNDRGFKTCEMTETNRLLVYAV